MASLILMILISLAVAFLFSEIFRFLGLPRVVGQISAGIFLGINVIRNTVFTPQNMQVLDFLANLGIILLFYYLGMELNLTIFSKDVKKSFVISLFKAFTPLVLGFIVARFVLHLNPLASLIIAICLSAGAQSVTIDILEELKKFKSRLGTIIISAGIITDVIELIIVTIILAVLQITSNHIGLLKLFVYLIIFIVFIVIARIFIVKYILKLFDREGSSTARFTAALIVLLIVVSLTEFLGIGALIGALAAGIIIRQTIYKDVTIPDYEERDIARSIHVIAFGFLIPLFFVWVGLNTDISLMIRHYSTVLILTLVAFVGVIGGVILGVRFAGGKLKEGVILGFGLSPKGDIGFVIGALALEAGIITDQIFTSLVLMALIVTIISPIVFKKLVIARDSV